MWLERAPLVYDSDVAGHDEGECWHAKKVQYETLFETRDSRDAAVECGDGDETFKDDQKELEPRRQKGGIKSPLMFTHVV
jgi:hypothetical protein